MVVRQCLNMPVVPPLLIGAEEPKSHISAYTELYLDVRERFLRSSSVSPSFRGGNTADGMRIDRSMTNSPRMVLSRVDSERRLVCLVLKVGSEEVLATDSI